MLSFLDLKADLLYKGISSMSDDSDCNSPKLHSQVKVLFETQRQRLTLKGGIPSFLSGTQLLFPLAIKYVTHQIRKLALLSPIKLIANR